jgi:hypothetical protein
MAGNASVRLWLAFATCAVLAAGFAAWALWPQPKTAAPQARRYLDVTACLLTSQSGITQGSSAAPVWASMERASLATHVMVSYLADTGPADVPAMLNTLIERQCGVIITTGADPGQVIDAARANPRQRFVLVAASGTPGLRVPPNAVAVSPANAPERVDQALRALATAA